MSVKYKNQATTKMGMGWNNERLRVRVRVAGPHGLLTTVSLPHLVAAACGWILLMSDRLLIRPVTTTGGRCVYALYIFVCLFVLHIINVHSILWTLSSCTATNCN